MGGIDKEILSCKIWRSNPLKVFVTVGFERRPFDRLLMTIDNGIEEGKIPDDTFIQIGHSKYLPRICSYQRFLKFNEMEQKVKNSDIIIAHAGVGTILLCLRHNKIPILFPRDAILKEHVDNHQLEFCRIMEKQKRALVAYHSKDLFEAVSNYDLLSKTVNINSKNADNLSSYLKKILLETKTNTSIQQ